MKIVVFDDDPTGSQTVYGCTLLLRWDQEILSKAISDNSPLLFLLTNTRSLSAENAEARIREICQTLKQVIKENNFLDEDLFIVSRGDSTLRGHGFLEPKVINEELGPFDATFHVPAFIEGGRTTVNGIHFLNGIPMHKTIFAEDKIFGYSNSHLAFWLEEKSNGLIPSKSVNHITIDQLNKANISAEEMLRFLNYLSALSSNQSVIVDAKYSIHLDVFASAIRKVNDKKRFLFRSAASLINSLSQVYSNSNSFKDFSSLRLKDEFGLPKPGLIVVGSHVQLADDQLSTLLDKACCVGVQLPVQKIVSLWQGDSHYNLRNDLEIGCLKQIIDILQNHKTPVIYTSRGEISFSSKIERINFGIYLAEFMAYLIAQVSTRLGYIVSKGGITTHILLTKGFKLSSVHLKGQILPGLSVVTPKEQNMRNIPIITFPGNLGDKKTLLEVWNIMEKT